MKTIVSLLICLLAALPLTSAASTVRYDERDGLSSYHVGGGVADHHGLLWFATWKGLCCYDGYEFHPLRIVPGGESSLATDRIRDILPSPDGSDNIICHTDDDIFRFSLSDYTYHDLDSAAKARLAPLVGKRWHGLADPQGGLWQTDGRGLIKTFTESHPAMAHSATAGLNVRAMLASGGRLRAAGIAGDSPRLLIFASDGSVSASYPLDAKPYCIMADSRGNIWTGCKPGAVYRLDPTGAFVKFQCGQPVYDMLEDSTGRIWLATFGGGIKVMDGGDGRIADASRGEFANARVRKLLLTPSGHMIASTGDGVLVARLPPQGQTGLGLRAVRRRRGDAASLASNSTMSVVRSVGRDGKGRIFVATESAGVDMADEASLLSDSPVFTHLSSSSTGLTSDACDALMAGPDSMITVVGSSGVSLLNPSTGEVINLSEPFWADTCRFTECTPIILSDGSLALATETGILTATPAAIHTPGHVPPIVFTTLSTRGGKARFVLPPLSEVSLRADERNLSVGFAAIDYVDNSHILYQTSLDGSVWSAPSAARTVNLFDLGPGRHSLRVRSTDRFGRPAENARELILTVGPLWHETWWARALFALAAVGFVAAVVYTILYIRRLKRRHRELLQKYMELISAATETPAQTPAEDPLRPMAEPLGGAAGGQDDALLERVRRYVEENISNPDANVADMAAAAAASRATLNRKLKSNLGVSASQLLTEARMRRAADLMRSARPPGVAEAAGLCGYADPHYFQRVFSKRFGVPFRSGQSARCGESQ